MRSKVRVALALLVFTLVCGAAAAQTAPGFRPLTDFAQLQTNPFNKGDTASSAPLNKPMTLASNAQAAIQGMRAAPDRRFYTARIVKTEPRRATPPFFGGFGGMPSFYGPYGWNKPYRWDGPYRYYGSFGWDWGGVSDKVVGKVLENMESH
jgi:hypothetical protein